MVLGVSTDPSLTVMRRRNWVNEIVYINDTIASCLGFILALDTFLPLKHALRRKKKNGVFFAIAYY